MKLRVVILAAIGALLALWIVQGNSARAKRIEAASKVASVQMNRANAKGLLLAECTNHIAGLSRVSEVSIDDSADVVSKWTGRATVEYVNSAGRQDRTNLLFVFGTPYGNMQCILDPQWQSQAQRQQLQRTLEAASK